MTGEPEPSSINTESILRPVTINEVDSRMKSGDQILAVALVKFEDVLKDINTRHLQSEAAKVVDHAFDERTVEERIAEIHEILAKLKDADLPVRTLEDNIRGNVNRLQIEVGRTLVREVGINEMNSLHEANYKFSQLGTLCAQIDRAVNIDKDDWPGAENMLTSRYSWFGTRNSNMQTGEMIYKPSELLQLDPAFNQHFPQLYARFTDAYAEESLNRTETSE